MVHDVNEGWLSAGREPAGKKAQPTRGKPKPPGKRPGTTQATAGKAKVTSYTRTVETGRGLFGPRKREVRVKTHNRGVRGTRTTGGKRKVPAKKRYQAKAKAAISPQSARKNLREAWRQNRRGFRGKAIALAAIAAIQLLLWLTLQATFLAVGGVVVFLAGVALIIEEVTD